MKTNIVEFPEAKTFSEYAVAAAKYLREVEPNMATPYPPHFEGRFFNVAPEEGSQLWELMRDHYHYLGARRGLTDSIVKIACDEICDLVLALKRGENIDGRKLPGRPE